MKTAAVVGVVGAAVYANKKGALSVSTGRYRNSYIPSPGATPWNSTTSYTLQGHIGKGKRSLGGHAVYSNTNFLGHKVTFGGRAGSRSGGRSVVIDGKISPIQDKYEATKAKVSKAREAARKKGVI